MCVWGPSETNLDRWNRTQNHSLRCEFWSFVGPLVRLNGAQPHRRTIAKLRKCSTCAVMQTCKRSTWAGVNVAQRVQLWKFEVWQKHQLSEPEFRHQQLSLCKKKNSHLKHQGKKLGNGLIFQKMSSTTPFIQQREKLFCGQPAKEINLQLVAILLHF